MSMIASDVDILETDSSTVQPPKILIIDDETALQQAIKIAFRGEDYQLYFADNGKEGLKLFRKYNPDLIFLDLKMPVMDGYQFMESIDHSVDSEFTVIAITGHGADREIERCYKLGVDFFLKKPLSMVEIICLTRRCIEVKRLKAERERLIEDLQAANDTISYLKEFLVICSSCKRVRDENEQWQDLDTYIREHTSTEFSHGICPKCMTRLYPDLPGLEQKEKKK